jgi:PAS domain S-box-containing protein
MSARRGCVFLLLALCLALPARARAEPRVLALNELRDSAPLGLFLEVLEDPSRALTFDDVSHGAYAERFRRVRKFIPSYGITYSAYWVRFAVRNDSAQPLDAVLVGANPQMAVVDFYASGDGDRFVHLRSGQGVPVSQRSARDRRQIFPATLEPKTPLVIYLRFETAGVMAFDLALWDARALLRADNETQLALGIYLGLIGALIVYNLLLYSAFQERSYLYYALFVMGFGAYQACLSGFAAVHLWPEHPYWALRSTLFFGGAAIFYGVAFTRRFLDVAVHAPRMDTVFRVLMALAVAVLLGTFIDMRATDYLATADVFVSFVAIVIAAILCWLRGFRPARHLLLAWALFTAGGLVFTLVMFGVVEPNVLTLNTFHFGFGVSGLLLSFALGDRVRSMHDRHAQEMAETVAARTADLKRTIETLDREMGRREETVRALRDSERRLADIIDFLPDATLVVDTDGAVIAWNRAIETVTGIQAAEMLGKKGYDYAVPFYGERRPILIDLALRPDVEIESRYFDISRAGDVVAGEAYMPGLRGGTVYLYGRAAPLRGAGGEIVGAIESIRDITDRKHAEERLADSERRYRLLADNLQDAIWTMDLNFHFTFMSPSVERIRGYTAEEAMALPFDQTLPPSSLARAMAMFAEEFQRDGQPGVDPFRSRTIEVEQYRKDGSTVWTEAVVTFLRDEQLRPIGVLGTTRDVTERKRMEAEVIAAKDRAETANRAKSDFLANMSHELRTPLSAILGFSELLQEKLSGELTERQGRYVAAIHVSGRHLLDLIGDILDLSKVEAGKMALDLGAVKLGDVIESGLAVVRELALHHRIDIAVDVPAELCGLTIEADERKLKQILFNILSNAVKFTPDGGAIFLGARREGELLFVHVRDTGIGIKPEEQERIFQPFERLENPYTRVREGAGLGLALTARLVQLHGGRLWVESAGEGRGSTFTFTIVIRRPTNRPSAPAAAVT